MTKREMLEKIENLENEVKRLNFIVKNGGENKTATKVLRDILHFGSTLELRYINVVSSEVESIRLNCVSLNPKSTIYKDTKTEAIIKIDDFSVCWYKLDKLDNVIMQIPEPAEYAEKNEVTNDDGLKESN